MPTTTYMSLVLPTEDGSSGVWDTLLNAAATLVDSHDHSSGKGVTVKTAGISINADLPYGGFAATGVKAVDFNAIAAATMSGYAGALFMSSADNELYWRTSGGVNVKVTSGTSLNSALLGGFTGDYGSGDEEAEFTSGTGIYDFRVNDTTRAYLDASDIRLFEATSGITNAVKLKSPASLAASYTLTMPAALPGSTAIAQISSAGVITASNTVANAVSLSSTLGVSGATTLAALSCTTLAASSSATVGTTLGVTGATTLSSTLGVTGAATLSSTLGVTGAVTLSSTLGVTGLITATAGLTAAANQHVTVSGTGRFKHGTMTMIFPAFDGKPVSPDADNVDYGTAFAYNNTASTLDVVFSGAAPIYFRIPVRFPVGTRIRDVAVDFAGAGTNTKGFALRRRSATGTSTGIVTGTSTANTTVSLLALGDANYTVLSTETYWLQFDSADAGDVLKYFTVTYDYP
jgi:hypothetical protein